MLLVWCRLHKVPVSVLRVVSPVASYHVTAPLLCPDDRSFSRVVSRRYKHKPGSSGWRDHERSVQGQVWKNEMPAVHRKGDDHRVSSELRKLCLEDSPAEREGPVKQRSTLDSRAESYEVVFGIAPCLLALTQGRRKTRKLFVKDGQSSHRDSVLKVCEEAFRQQVQIQRVNKKELDRMSSGRVHQGVCLHASPLDFLTEHTDLKSDRKGNLLWLVLEGIQDPMNFGAILRSAYFLGVDRVISSLHNSCPLTPVVSKASSGVMEVLGVYGCENLEDMIKLKVACGWQVVGTVAADVDRSVIPVTQCLDFQVTKPTLLLIGGEGEGLSQELLSLCQTLLTIPAGRDLCSGVESLNVSVATGILLHSLLSSRRRSNR